MSSLHLTESSTWASTTCASLPFTTLCTCSPTLAQELHPTSTKPTTFTYCPPYCWQSHDKARCMLWPGEISEWRVIISTKISKYLRKKKEKYLMRQELKANRNDALSSPLSTRPTLICFGLWTLQGRDSPPSYILHIGVPCISIVLHKLYVPWRNVLALSRTGLACLWGMNQMLRNSVEKFHHQLKIGFGSRTSNNFILCITLME